MSLLEKLETIHFDIDINFLGETCKCLEDNTISDSFSKLKKLYFFLVNYVIKSPDQRVLSPPAPGVVSKPSTGLTALHLLLWKGKNLQFNSLGCTIMDWSCCYCAEETWTLIPWSFVFEDFAKKIGIEYLDHKVPPSMIQFLFYICFQKVKQGITGRKQDFTSPHLFVPFLFVLFTHSIDKLELPGLIRIRDRITVLFLIPSTANLKKLKLHPKKCKWLAYPTFLWKKSNW